MNGLTDAELGDLRRAYGRQVKPCHGGLSATAKLALDGDHAIRQAIVPILQWSRLLWEAIARPERALVSKEDKFLWWDSAVTFIGRPLRWAKSRGPLERAALCLARVGGVPRSGFPRRDHLDQEVRVDQLAPTVLDDLLTRAMQRMRECQLADKWDIPAGVRATCDLMQSAVRERSKKYSKYQEFLARTCARQGLQTGGRAKERGYDTDDLCSRGQPDIVHHRLYSRTRAGVATARVESEGSAHFVQEGLDNDGDLRYVTGAFAHEEDLMPPMEDGAKVHLLDVDGEAADCGPETLCDVIDPSAQAIEIAADGSRSVPVLDAVRRAGWAIGPPGGRAASSDVRGSAWLYPSALGHG